MASPIVTPGFIVSPYGWRNIIVNGVSMRNYHVGMDLVNYIGQLQVFSIAPGVVTKAYKRYNHNLRFSNQADFMGNWVEIRHQIGGYYYLARYFHLTRNLVVPGQNVSDGQLIGSWGDVGFANGAHLHIEILQYDKYSKRWVAADPTYLFTKYGIVSPAFFQAKTPYVQQMIRDSIRVAGLPYANHKLPSPIG